MEYVDRWSGEMEYVFLGNHFIGSFEHIICDSAAKKQHLDLCWLAVGTGRTSTTGIL